MTSLSKTAKIFIHHDVLSSESGRLKLRLFFNYADEISDSLIVEDLVGSDLNLIQPIPAQQEWSFVAQKLSEGYLYGTVHSFMQMVGITV